MRRRLARTLAIALVAAAGLVAFPATVHAVVPDTNWAPADISDVRNANHLLTHPDGSVTAGCGGGGNTTAFKTFHTTGTVTQSRATAGFYGNLCAGTSAVGRDGTVFTLAYPDGVTPKIQAFKNNDLEWSYTIPCGAFAFPQAMVVGTNGNLYMVTANGNTSQGCSPSRLIGLTPGGQNGAGQVVLNEAVTGSILPGGLAAYSNGLVLRYQYQVQYVSYGGSFDNPIDTPNTPNWWGFQEKFDAALDGRAFVPNNGSNLCPNSSDTAESISAIEPSGVVWTAPLVDCSYVRDIRPVYDGGFAALIEFNLGNAVIKQVVRFDKTGEKLWNAPLSDEVPNGNLVTNSVSIAVDMNGNIAILFNQVISKEIGGLTYQFPQVAFTLANGFTGALIDHALLGADTSTTSGPSYRWENTVVRIGKGAVYVVANECTNASFGCTPNGWKLYPISIPGLEMDYPRGAILRYDEPWQDLVVLGDSFSSGEGAGHYDPLTNIPATESNFNVCHRSDRAYYHLLAGNAALRLAGSGFIACSGAQTEHIINTFQYANQPDQAAQLSNGVDIVILSIGGNDIHFGDFTRQCVFGSCAGSSHDSTIEAIENELPNQLASAYSAIRNEVGSQTRILALGYPMMVPSTNEMMSCGALDSGELLAARHIIAQLNDAISTAVEMADTASGTSGPRFEFVAMNGEDSPFNGHELCSADPYFNDLEPLSGSISALAAESYHPNAKGHHAYASLIAQYLSQ